MTRLTTDVVNVSRLQNGLSVAVGALGAFRVCVTVYGVEVVPSMQIGARTWRNIAPPESTRPEMTTAVTMMYIAKALSLFHFPEQLFILNFKLAKLKYLVD